MSIDAPGKRQPRRAFLAGTTVPAPRPLTELCACFQALARGCPVCSPRSSGQYPLTSLCLSLTQCGTPRALSEPVQAQSPEVPLCSSDLEERKEGLCSAAARVTPARLAAFTCFTVKPRPVGMRLSCRSSGKVRERGEGGWRDQETVEKESSLKEGKQTQDLRAQGASGRTPALDRGHLTSDAAPVPSSTNPHWHPETGGMRSPEPSAGCEGDTREHTRFPWMRPRARPSWGSSRHRPQWEIRSPLLLWVALPGAEWASGWYFTSHLAPGLF